ncbi:hypothetical protein FHR24_000601 [Wenyingzhuangia heitensis]|uniref:LTXXQ motif family protein n=1 Tax=Wenyingzhuangia heitensis TaxID=1487859 RepID=A0ABX0UAT0_9FLAO|nr:hypothetical protein [Wenyingzhuangia heitensis]NIJ44162.1 hypothetical protein [Wenyingzhuangia heitensis]
MKQVSLLFALLITLSISAQKRHHLKNDFTAEQKTQLMVKKMTVALDLSEKQVTKITPIITVNVREMEKKMADRKANKESRKDLSSDEKYNLAMSHLDEQAKLNKLMKDILDKDQYVTWTRMQKKHDHKMKMRHARKEGFKRKHHQKEA